MLHAFWLAGLWVLGWTAPLHLGWVAVFLALQISRVWVFATLGGRWTTRIIVLPGAPLVRHGPYRFVSHPNYLVVIGEIAGLPPCLGLQWDALAFSVANLAVLTIRVRAETATFGRLLREFPGTSNGRHLDRLCRDVRWHVHGDPRRTGRGDIAAGDPGCACYPHRPDELAAIRLSGGGNDRDPADRCSGPGIDYALAVRSCDRDVHDRVIRLRDERTFRPA